MCEEKEGGKNQKERTEWERETESKKKESRGYLCSLKCENVSQWQKDEERRTKLSFMDKMFYNTFFFLYLLSMYV